MSTTLKQRFRELINPEFNDEPVHYCKHCLSLRVMHYDGMDDFCDECGGSDIGEASIFEWENLYKERYNTNHLSI